MKKNVLIGGDVVPWGGVANLFELGDIRTVLGEELFNMWNEADYRFFNLECPITKSEEKISKCGPHLKCDPDVMKGIKGLSPSCVFLANNHIMDYSTKGLKDTISLLDKNALNWVGVGDDIDSVKKSFIVECGGRKMGIYNCCEHEFSVASKNVSGANPYDEFVISDDLKDIRRKSDYLIVIYHGGKEHYRYPSPLLQRRCRKLVEDGADLVVCQHSHCIGCEEKYNGSTIVYGQGNFIFNRLQNEYWNTALLINVELSDKNRVKYIPIVQSPSGVRLADKKEADYISRMFNERSERIKRNGFIESEYEKYANKEIMMYLARIKSGFLSKIMRKFFPNVFMKSFNYEGILNIVECESHRELFAQGLKDAPKIIDVRKKGASN